MLKKGLLVTLIVFCLLVVATIPAFATSPIHYEGEFDDPPWFLTDCSGYGYDFEITAQESGWYKGKESFTKEGYLKIQEHISGTDVLTNSVSGKEISGKWTANNVVVIVDETEDFYTRHGMFWHFNYPGLGNVLLDTGHISVHWMLVDDVWEMEVLHWSGHFTALNDDYEMICAALAD